MAIRRHTVSKIPPSIKDRRGKKVRRKKTRNEEREDERKEGRKRKCFMAVSSRISARIS